ncbi:MAG: tetratricopeptide repeat protein [Thermodesulfobacteriota bacterium]|nr:tetratricopeptide repeat protein [Thermodesulfobacteriota bacterium]
MSRFENLEISIKPTPPETRDNRVYDEVYYLDLAKKSHLNGDFETALKYYSRSLGYKKESVEAWAGQVLCLIDLGEFKEAALWAERAIEVAGNSPELLAVKAMALGRTGEIEKALGFSDQAVKKGGKQPILWLSRADVMVAREYGNAEFCIKKAMESDPHSAFVNLRIAMILMSVNENAPALNHLKQALIREPKSPFVLYLIAKCYHLLGVIDQAEEYYQKALRIKPDFKECARALEQASDQGILGNIYCKMKNLFTNRKN